MHGLSGDYELTAKAFLVVQQASDQVSCGHGRKE